LRNAATISSGRAGFPAAFWEMNRKDLGDALCLLADHPIAAVGRPVGGPAIDATPAAIDLVRPRLILGADWGFCHTFERNLRAVADLWREAPIPGAQFGVDRQVATLLKDIDMAPESIGWKARSRVGERVRWYETPEEARR
jgi:hypothetical protein